MKILVINSGSSSLKYQLFNNNTLLAKGQIERIGKHDAIFSYENIVSGEKEKNIGEVIDHKDALRKVLAKITNEDTGIIESIQEIQAIGHRVVHGGEFFSNAIIIDEEAKHKIKELIQLAPLHNPANLMGIEVCEDLLPEITQVAVFDTSFHQSLPPESYLYSLPRQYYEKYKLRRYGFHGISHEYVYNRAKEIMNNKSLKAISCHIGNGASVCAIENGNVLATSMGFTPIEGLIMGTRSGDIDPGALLFLMEKEGLSPNQMSNILNKESGVLGLSGYSNDLRDIEEGHIEEKENDTLVMNIYINQIVKYIGAYYVLMGGCDIIIFTAGVMEKSPYMRALLMTKLSALGITLDEEANEKRNTEIRISSGDSTLPVRTIPTDEEGSIARQVMDLLG